MIKQLLINDLETAIKKSGFEPGDIVLASSENVLFGDYTSNIPLQLSKQKLTLGEQSPRNIANTIIENLGHPQYLERVEVAGPGFINFWIKDSVLVDALKKELKAPNLDNPKKYLVEYGHANPLKEIHIGHVRTYVLGESISRILQYIGNDVFRCTYNGDVGLHIAKTLWAVQREGIPEGKLTLEEKVHFLGQAYALGGQSYENDLTAKEDIDRINKQIYAKDPEIMPLYHLTRDWALEYFEPIYKLLDVRYDHRFWESEVYEIGKALVESHIGSVFEESEGAIIFPGEKYGLHNRVFISSAGNPTYEAKDMGLGQLMYDTFNYDKAIHIVAREQEDYFKVVFKALELVLPYLKDKKYHMSYGFVDLKGGKMSSRSGNVITFYNLLDIVSNKLREQASNKSDSSDETITKLAIAAIKFAYLKYSPEPNMLFDLEQSVSLQGDSGIYVMYVYARIQSILKFALKNEQQLDSDIELETEERDLLRLVEYFPSIIESAANRYHPNDITAYLLLLARSFNRFYEKHPVIGSNQVGFRLALVSRVGEVIKQALDLLGIETVDKM